MHIVYWTVAGLVILGLVILATEAIDYVRGSRLSGSVTLFIWAWLFASLFNFYNGWIHHNIPFLNEVGAFIPIFGVPAALAWFWARRTHN